MISVRCPLSRHSSSLSFCLLTAVLNRLAERCPHLGCGKEFSRKDNMQQHLKIHQHTRQQAQSGAAKSKGKGNNSRQTSEDMNPAEEEDDGEESGIEDESHST